MADTFAEFTSKSKTEILQTLQTNDQKGLSQKEAETRLKKYGKNITQKHHISAFKILIRQIKSPFIYLLFGASILSLLLGEITNALFIILFVFINTILGFYQEFKSEQTAKLLQSFIASKAKVLRDGEISFINASELVPGDIIYLSPGDIIQADVRIITSDRLEVDESILTGESTSQRKTQEPLTQKTKEIFEAKNILFSGTTVISGSATGVVIATANQKVIGKIAKLATESTRENSLERGVSNFSKFILKMVGATLVIMFIANIAIKGTKTDIPELLLFTIALAVSVIPEALPVVTTFSLSRGALRLSKHKVVVKRLAAIENLGSISILCSDKTGTITENKMTVSNIFDPYSKLMSTAALSDGKTAFDIAISEKLTQIQKQEVKQYKLIDEYPFDPQKRTSSTLRQKGKKQILIIRGAPEVLMETCKYRNKKAKDWIISEGKGGKRILAFAQKEKNAPPKFMGLISFSDPLKKTAPAAIKKAKELGVEIKILTGDRAEVAGALGVEVNLIKDESQVMLGSKFENLNSTQKHDAVEKYQVFARVTPEQKYEIIKLLQEHHDVGFLGEGINDAPALKISDVGIVVNDASDVAKESSDIILLQKSLMTVVNGIEEGRGVFANTIKYIKTTLASNFGNFYAVATASLLINYLPLLPLQILLVNLLSDFPMISIATDSVDPDELKKPKLYNLKEIAFSSTVLGLVSSGFDFLTFAVFYSIAPGVLQTNWFVESIITELLLIYSLRSKKFFPKALISNPPSREIVFLTAVAGGITIILPFTQVGQTIFQFIKPTSTQFITVIAISISYLISTEATKLLLKKTLSQ